MKTDESCRIPRQAGQLAELLLSATILAAAAVLTVHAQTFRGAIVGTVIDQSQAPAPDVKVTAKNQATGLTRTASTDTSGNYDIPELPLGDYTVTLEKEGFETVTQADVRVDVAAERRIDVTLVPGKLQQTVEVTAAAPLIQSTTNVLGGTIEGPQAENLPVNGRDYTKLIYM